MKHLTMFCAIVALAGCNKKSSDEPTPTKGSDTIVAKGSAGSAGSAAPTGNGSATASGSASAGSASAGSGSATTPATPKKILTGVDFEKAFAVCWGFWNAGKFDDLKGCFTADAVNDVPGAGEPDVKGNQAIADAIKSLRGAFPDQRGEIEVAMVSGTTLISIMLITGTNSGPIGPAQPTGKKIGVELAQVLDMDAAGRVTHESDYFDQVTMLGQIGVVQRPVREATAKPMLQEIAVGTDDDREKANLATFTKLTAALNKHDKKAAGELFANDLVWSEAAAPKDVDKKGALDGLEGLWKAFGNLKLSPTKSWAAGDFVAAVETFEGTNNGTATMMGGVKATGKKVSLPVLAVYRFDGGKITRAWIFYQSSGLLTQLGLATK